jgi:hypothetical protein
MPYTFIKRSKRVSSSQNAFKASYFFFQKTHLNSNLELQLQVGGWNSSSRPSTRSGLASESGANQDFKSCFARTLDVSGTDRVTWLEQVKMKLLKIFYSLCKCLNHYAIVPSCKIGSLTSDLYCKHITIVNDASGVTVCDTTIRSITLKLTIMILKASI